MFKDVLLETLYTKALDPPTPLLSKTYFFHDIQVTCQTNHPGILAILDKLLRIFPEPGNIRGEVTYFVLCYDSPAQFPQQLPHDQVNTETVYLLTNTKLAYYRSDDYTTYYQSYAALPPVNQVALSVIHPDQDVACTQLMMPQHYQATFLRRYVFLLALGQLMHKFGFEPCHAGAITAPRDAQQGALIIGSSGSGKTTLSIACTVIGCALLGDDLVMLRESTGGLLRAYAISHELSIRSGTVELLPELAFLRDFPTGDRDKRYCSIEQIGTPCLETSIRLLLFPSLTTEAQSAIVPLSKAHTLKVLIEECLGKRNTSFQAQEKLFALLGTLAEQAPGYRLLLARGANDGPQLVRSLLAGNVL